MNKIKAYTVATIFTFTSVSVFGAATESSTSTEAKKSTGPSITDSSKSTQKDNKMGQLMNIAMGALNYKIASSHVPGCSSGNGGDCAMAALHFLMGTQNLMQAKAQGKSGGQAGGAVYATDTGLGSSGYDPNAVDKLNADPEFKGANDMASRVAAGKGGFTYDPKTNSVTTPKGTTIKGSDLASESSLAAAGVPKAAIDMFSSSQAELLAKAAKKVSKLALNTNVVGGEESSSGGSGGDGSLSAGADSDSQLAYGAAGNRAGLGIDRDPAQVAGMQKNYNGEPIGVSGDSIFKMMTRRYKVKESQRIFLDESDLFTQK